MSELGDRLGWLVVAVVPSDFAFGSALAPANDEAAPFIGGIMAGHAWFDWVI